MNPDDHQQPDFLFKIVLLGDSGVGKTNLVLRFTENTFKSESKATVGVEFAAKSVKIQKSVVKAQIWDTAGQERYRSVTSSYYRGAVGVILVYDITDRISFSHIPLWLEELRENVDSDCLIMLVGNKLDLSDQRQIYVRDGKLLAKKFGMAFIETSALDATGVDFAFTRLLEEVHRKQMKKQLEDGSEKEHLHGVRSKTSNRYTPIRIHDTYDNENDSVSGCCLLDKIITK